MRLALVTAFVLVVLPATTDAQNGRKDAMSLEGGTRSGALQPTVGSKYGPIMVALARPDGLRHSLDPRLAAKSLAGQQISTMDASTNGHRHVGSGLLVGLIVGAIGGVAYGRSANPGSMGRGYNEAVGAIGLGAIGAACGAAVGYAWRSEN
jgi:hypothetical protein